VMKQGYTLLILLAWQILSLTQQYSLNGTQSMILNDTESRDHLRIECHLQKAIAVYGTFQPCSPS
jgi:hypothetical protein